ncbi:uncharacterized protein LOC112091134 [Morus notabilis]|uniref:uncharacterized protein LOC112091134 n=1 Tax=Morus notabilis TaxID=981085 RepID=UPI000CED4E5D|nr:uncharacterized protein LOC112091134 [Morus notabilis]
MPFGLSNAPSTFQATMNLILKPFLRRFVAVFFDDILVYSASISDHIRHLRQVLQVLREHQFFVKRSKCTFGQTSIEYLGHIVSNYGVSMDLAKVKAMLEWPVPNNLKELRGFLGLTGYYRRFVRSYATIASPLTDLLKKDTFAWTSVAQSAFDTFKAAMTSAPVLALPNFVAEFVVETDASNFGIGAVLLKSDHHIAYFSKKLSPRMQHTSVYVRELYAITEAVKKW